jgi:nicotinate-nucleotide adenylyltransferase
MSKISNRPIGIFGGSFDPPHLGHLVMALAAREILDLRAVWIVPAYQHPCNKKNSDFNLRLKMLALLFRSCAKTWVQIRTDERKIWKKKQPNYTVDTVCYYKKKYPGKKFVLILGSDLWKDMAKWKDYERLARALPIFVFPRPGTKLSANRSRITVKIMTPNISSTMIRALVRKKIPFSHLTGEPVAACIAEHKLYIKK